MSCRIVWATLLLTACGPSAPGTGDGDAGTTTTDSASAGSATATSSSTTSGSTTGGSTSGSATGSGSTSSGTTGGPEPCDLPEMPPPLDGPGCDIWNDDCPPGHKCAAYANDGGNSWNSHRCVPVVCDPSPVGEPCWVEDGSPTGVDNCGKDAFCFFIDWDTNTGTCIARCKGSESDPQCDDPCSTCTLSSDATLTPCLPQCDPFANDCPPQTLCVPGYLDAFICAWDSQIGAAAGEACEYVTACAPGLMCADASLVPGCAGGIGCCSTVCDLADPTGCDAQPGTTCQPVYEEPDAGCVRPVGVCLGP